MHGSSAYPWENLPRQMILRTRARMGTEMASARRESALAATIMQGRQGLRRLMCRSRGWRLWTCSPRKATYAVVCKVENGSIGGMRAQGKDCAKVMAGCF